MNLKKILFILLFIFCTSASTAPTAVVSAEETLESFEHTFEIDGTEKIGDILNRGSVAVLKEALRLVDETAEDSQTFMQDVDQDTKVQVEESDNEDKIRLDTGGTQRVQVDSDGLTLGSGASVNEFSTDGTLSGNSDDAVPTEKAVKTYADSARYAVTTETRVLTAAAGDVSYTGAGFTPTAVIVFAAIHGSTISSWGMSDGTTEACVLMSGADGELYVSSVLFMNLVSSAGNSQAATVKSFDSDGMTLTWAKTSTPTGTVSLFFTYLR